MPGFTAYAGLLNSGQPKPGETVLVSAASGAVGSVVGQIARINGVRAIGIAGDAEKCSFVRDELGFDAVVDHRDPTFPEQLAAVCPDGIDVYFETVGGRVWDGVFPRINPFSRIPVCGLVAQYNVPAGPRPGPDRLPDTMRAVLTRSLLIRSFIQHEFASQQPTFLQEAAGWIASGQLR